MNNDAFIAQVRDLILALVQDAGFRIEDWKTSMNPLEFGVLSWTLGAFYWNDRL